MAGIWYRRGTVSLINGSAVVNGAGVTWNDPAGGVQVGNIFFGPDGKAYEVAYVLSATQLQLASNYGGPTATAQPYSIVTPIVGSIPALSTKVAAVLGYAQGQYDSWQQILTGTGDVTLTAPDGSTITVPSLNGIAANKLDKTGTAAAATKLATARTITIGNTDKTFDGSTDRSWSVSEIGAAPAGFGLGVGARATTAQAETAGGFWRDASIDLAGLTLPYDGTPSQRFIGVSGDSKLLFGVRNGGVSTPITWTAAYSASNKPTASDVGALALAGGTINGPLSIAASSASLTINDSSGANNAHLWFRKSGVQRMLWYMATSDGSCDMRLNRYDASGNGLGEVVAFSNATGRTTFNGTVLPGADNTHTLGLATNRWATLYAGTGTINTSDAREKTAVTPLSAAEVAAAIDICNDIGTYQWLESIEKKTEDGARHHVGLTVQRAMEIMQGHGLEPLRYGFICYDQWEAEYQDVDDEAGELVRTVERQVTRAEERTTTEIKVVDGVPTQVTTITTELVPVYEDRAVVDEAGNPVLVNHPAEVVHHPAELDEGGAVITEAWDEVIRESYSTALTHPVPVMESVEVRYRRDVVREAGDRYSFRMDQLALFCLCGMAQSS